MFTVIVCGSAFQHWVHQFSGHILVTSLCWEHNSSGLHNVGSLESLIHMGYPPPAIWEEKAVKLNDEQWRNKIILFFICPQNYVWRLLYEKFWWCSLQSAVCFSVCCEDDHSCHCRSRREWEGRTPCAASCLQSAPSGTNIPFSQWACSNQHSQI